MYLGLPLRKVKMLLEFAGVLHLIFLIHARGIVSFFLYFLRHIAYTYICIVYDSKIENQFIYYQ